MLKREKGKSRISVISRNIVCPTKRYKVSNNSISSEWYIQTGFHTIFSVNQRYLIMDRSNKQFSGLIGLINRCDKILKFTNHHLKMNVKNIIRLLKTFEIYEFSYFPEHWKELSKILKTYQSCTFPKVFKY